MKTWMMPSVKIESFRANEYVSACANYLVETNELANNYVDLYEPEKHLYDSEYERVGSMTGGRVLVGNYNKPEVGWYPNVKGYHYDQNGVSTTPTNGWDYEGANHFIIDHTFTYIGTYSVYIYAMTDTAHGWVYKAGYTPSGIPTEDKAWS